MRVQKVVIALVWDTFIHQEMDLVRLFWQDLGSDSSGRRHRLSRPPPARREGGGTGPHASSLQAVIRRVTEQRLGRTAQAHRNGC